MDNMTFNTREASIKMARAIAAVAPFARGYINVTLEFPGNIVASVGADNITGLPEACTYRVYTFDDEANEVELPFALLDFDIINEEIERCMVAA